MQTIKLETRIAAPAMRVFLLSLNVDLHKASTSQTNEEAIAGITHGIMGPGDVVTWRARHFGLRLKHTSKITQYAAPDYFVDTMTHGAFRTFEHFHGFTATLSFGTIMRDELTFSSPLGMLGAAVDRLVLRAYLSRFLVERNRLVQSVAESDEWRQFIPDSLREECF